MLPVICRQVRDGAAGASDKARSAADTAGRGAEGLKESAKETVQQGKDAVKSAGKTAEQDFDR